MVSGIFFKKLLYEGGRGYTLIYLKLIVLIFLYYNKLHYISVSICIDLQVYAGLSLRSLFDVYIGINYVVPASHVFFFFSGTLNPDDQMGWSTADEEGKFRVEGCGYDFMSTPDPYVKIFTYCNAEKGKYTKTKVEYKFAPEVIEYGDIIVD